MDSRYKLRCSVYGHEKDVRGVSAAYFPDGAVVSASRDVTSRLWVPNEQDPGFHEGHCMSGHGNFVTCICVMPPSDGYPQGLIVTGGQDNMIMAYTLDSPQPVFKLAGHADTVCCLVAGKFGTLLSGSWDTTAKVWLNQKNVITMKGHEAAVWGVAIMPGGYMLTASADKTVKRWKAGQCEHTYVGHEDCVRGLAALSATEFLSCSNDGTIRRWLLSGECVHTYFGHENYIYSIAIMPNGEDFVTGGEDRTLRVWRSGQCDQSITHPAQSVWCVTVLPNGDIVTGASDGIIRVFTTAAERTADETEQKAFEEQLSKTTIPAQIGDIKTDELLGPQALLNPGKRDGQTLMIRDGNSITAHQWSAAEGRWQKIGDVTGGTGSGKKTYNGKEYDYVFDVDIQEDKPPLKLPYNATDDPWVAAHDFLADNDISQMYLDQVVKFIQAQTKGVDIGPKAPAVNMDPFTGGSSVATPSNINPQAPSSSMMHNPDPFTGGSGTSNGISAAPIGQSFFPESKFITFEAGNTAAILGKLKELNSGLDAAHQVPEASLAQLEGLMTGTSSTPEQYNLLHKLLLWPKDKAFPALDVLRLAVRWEQPNTHFFGPQAGTEFLLNLWGHLAPDAKPANQMLVLRTLTNAFKYPAGQTLLLEHREAVITAALGCGRSNKNVAIAFSSVLLNYAVLLKQSADVDAVSHCMGALAEVTMDTLDTEASFRLLVCLGTLVACNDANMALALSLGLRTFVTSLITVSDPPKVGQCARALESILK